MCPRCGRLRAFAKYKKAHPERRRESDKKQGQRRTEKVRFAKQFPPDWHERPIAWQIIGIILLSEKGYMSNAEVFQRLDSSRILICPYGRTWMDSASKSDCKKFINRIRKWVNRPGKNPASIPLKNSA
jgi:hypothetical protein